MKKSVYSIVLMDDVVDAIDNMAYSLGTNRSSLINQILAEKVSMMTPEMRMKDIFSKIEKTINDQLYILQQPSEAVISIKSALKYKYRPTINYSVELFRSFEGGVGRLKISLRTQSRSLIAILNEFFNIWIRLENKYLSKLFINGVPWKVSGMTFMRDFYSPDVTLISDEDIAQAISGYINLLDECIKIHFENISNTNISEMMIENKYKSYLNKGIIIL